jgi:hypothetical protein
LAQVPQFKVWPHASLIEPQVAVAAEHERGLHVVETVVPPPEAIAVVASAGVPPMDDIPPTTELPPLLNDPPLAHEIPSTNGRKPPVALK